MEPEIKAEEKVIVETVIIEERVVAEPEAKHVEPIIVVPEPEVRHEEPAVVEPEVKHE